MCFGIPGRLNQTLVTTSTNYWQDFDRIKSSFVSYGINNRTFIGGAKTRIYISILAAEAMLRLLESYLGCTEYRLEKPVFGAAAARHQQS